jgi:putative inorganic carbon (HCO3(-)) transporter
MRAKKPAIVPIEEFYALRPKAIWQHVKTEHFSFWMICAYLFVEYVRPQSIIPSLDVLPWAKVFLVLSLIGRLVDRSAKWVSDSANLWITAFLLVIVLSSSLAVYPDYAWSHFMDFASWYVIYFLIVNIIYTEKRLLIFIALFLICSFKLSWFGAKTWTLRGFAFTTWGLQGPPGFFQNSGELAIQMLMFSPVAYELAMFTKPYTTKLKHYVFLLFPLTGAMTVMGASSRGGQIAMAYQSYRLLLKGRLSLKVLVGVALFSFAAWNILPAEQKARFSTAGDDMTSKQRLLYWQHGREIIETHPLLGIGYFNFPPYFAAHWPQDLLRGPAFTEKGLPVSELPHNIFVQVGTDAGLIGLSVFGLLLWRNTAAAREVMKECRAHPDRKKPFGHIAKGLLIALWGFVIAGQFVTVTYYPFFWVNLALTVALRNISKKEFASEEMPKPAASVIPAQP